MLIATFVVVAIGSIAFGRRAGPPNLKIYAAVSGTPTPTAQRPDAASAAVGQHAFLGSGSWTMSSLPSCFTERERVRGSLGELRSQFPPAAARLRAQSVISTGDCRIVVGAHDVSISRGADRLRVPPEAELYRVDGRLTLVYIQGRHAEIRRY